MPFDCKYGKTRQQIVLEYGICTKTLAKWLKEEGIVIKKGLISFKMNNNSNSRRLYEVYVDI